MVNYQHSVEMYSVFILYDPDISYFIDWRLPLPEVNPYMQSSHNVVNATFHIMKTNIRIHLSIIRFLIYGITGRLILWLRSNRSTQKLDLHRKRDSVLKIAVNTAT